MVSDTDPLEDNHYPIVEIFDSIQGEGSWLGIPSTFIRFGGCNLRCSWCDTKKSWENAPHLSIADIIQKIHYDFIILTGGEPTLYHLDPLLLEIKKKNPNVRIAIETNGTRKVTAHIDWITVSPKPDANYKIIPKPNELKYVVVQNFQVAVIPEQYYHNIPIWLQPNGYDLQASMKTAFELVMKYPFLRLGVQLHKMYNVA